MLIEAVRMYLVALGVSEASSWPAEQVIEHVDEVLLNQQNEAPEIMKDLIADLTNNVHQNLLTINKVLDA